MEYNVWEKNLESFCEDISSIKPTPGGGSVSIVSARLGLNLVLMAVNITQKKETNFELNLFSKKIEEIEGKLKLFADRDILVFNELMSTYKLARNTEDEKQVRASAIQLATIEATIVPLNAAELMLELMEIVYEIYPTIKQNVLSDISAGLFLIYASFKSILLNVVINLPTLIDIHIKDGLLTKYLEVKKRGGAIYNKSVNRELFFE